MPAFVDSHFTVRQPAWHDLTGEYDHEENPATIDELLEWSGTDWEPISTPVFGTKESHKCASSTGCSQLAVSIVNDAHYACGRHTNVAQSKGLTAKPLALKQLAGFQSIQRSDTGEVLNVANQSYETFGNREAAELVEMMLDSTVVEGGVKFETGGSLKGGKLVWYLARLDDPIEVKGDSSPIYPYLSVLNSHDGSAALRVINTNIRIVCWNTWSAAERETSKSGREFSFRHTGTIRDRIQEARDVVLNARSEAEEWAAYAEKLIAIPISDDDLTKYLELYVPMPPTVAISDRVENNIRETRQRIRNYYHSPSCASIAGTAWGVIQAVGEYLDHGRDYRTPDTYVGRTMLKPEQGKHKAIKLLKEVVPA